MLVALAGLLSSVLVVGSAEIPPPTDAIPGFGRALDATDAYLIVGTPEGNGGKGHVAIFDRSDPTTPIWTLGVSTFGDAAAAGTAVAIDGEWAVIGVPGDNRSLILNYVADGPTPGWQEHEWLTPPPGVAEFGQAIDLNGHELLIGAPGGVEAVGAWGLEDYTFPDGTTQVLWTSYGFLGSPLPPGSRWGHAVTIDSGTAFVGAPEYNGGSGRIHSLYLLDGVLEPGADLTDEIPWTNGRIGWDIMCRNGQLYVTAPSYGLNEASGIIWVLRNLQQDDGSFAWSLNNYLTPPANVLSSQFGFSVFTNGSRVGIGAPSADGTGAVYLYDCSVSDDDFPTFPYLGSFSPDGLLGDALFGTDLFIGPTTLAVAAPGSDQYGPDHGRILLLDLETISAPVNQQVPYDLSVPQTALEGLAPGAVTAFGSRVVLGVHHANDYQGIVQLVDDSNGSWVQDAVLQIDDGSQPNLFGYDVAQHENILAVGAPGVDGSGNVYIFEETEAGYEFRSKILPPRSLNIAFGYAVDVTKDDDGNAFVAIGSPGITLGTGQVNNPGSCYLYRAGAADYTSWSLLVNRISDEPKSLLGIDVEIERMDSGLVLAAGEPSFLLSQGAVWMYTGSFAPDTWTELPSVFGEVADSAFGTSIALKGRYLVVGAPGSTANAPAGAAYAVALIDGEVEEWHVMTPAPGDTVGVFGASVAMHRDDQHYRVAVGVRGFRGGSTTPATWTGSAADLFTGQILEGGSFGALSFGCRVVNPDVSHGLGSQVAFNASRLFMINSRSDAEGLGPVARGTAAFDVADRTYWLAADGGDVTNPGNWSVDPKDGDTLVFSLLGTTRYLVEIGGIVNAHLQVLYDKVILIADDQSPDKVKSITIDSDAAVESASIVLGGGPIEVEGDITVGGTSSDSAGSLYLAVGGRVTCGTLAQSSTGQMGYGISQLTSESTWIVDAAQVEIAGSLQVQILAGLAETLAVGDTFNFIRSASAPPEGGNRFGVIVLPALPNGLTLLPKYSDTTPRSGTSQWFMELIVISVADLLAFNDPNSVTVNDNAMAVEVADLTGDGAEEICLIFDGTPGSLVIYENDGAGGIAQQIIVNTGDAPVDITSGDFDDNGTIDLAVANAGDDNVTVYYNDDSDVTTGFTTVDVPIFRTPTCLAGINYNFDSLRDLVIGVTDDDADGNGDWLFLEATLAARARGFNSGGALQTTGTPLGVDPSEEEDQKDIPFSGRKSNGRADIARFNAVGVRNPVLEISEYTVGAAPSGLANADLDGDGWLDVAVTSRTNGTIAILLQDPTAPGTFLGPTYVPLGQQPLGMTAIDFNLDGTNDLAAIMTDDDGFQIIRVLQNNGDLTFTSIDVGKGEFPILVDSGDVDGNGNQELVTIGDSGTFRRGGADPLLSVREVDSISACPGDANGNGVVDVKDLLIVLAEFGTCTSSCSGDFDGDDDVDIDDLLRVIARWGDCADD